MSEEKKVKKAAHTSSAPKRSSSSSSKKVSSNKNTDTSKKTVKSSKNDKKKLVDKNGKIRRDLTKINIAVVVIAAIVNILLIYILFTVTQFASLSTSSFVILNLVVLLLLIALDALIYLAIRTKKLSFFIGTGVMLALFAVIGIYGTYAVVRVNGSLSNMTATTVQESVSTSFVIYNTNADDITDVTALEGKTVGYMTGSTTAELGQSRLESEGINASLTAYQDYSSLLLALFNEDIDAAILPTNYQDMFSNEEAFTEFLANTSSIMDFTSNVTVSNSTGSDKDLTTEPFTVLLLGTADGLSDTMILCSVNPISMKITMSSIARDSYVPISCYNGGESKLNAARSVSIDCTVQTIEDLVGVEIDYYIDTNFQGVVDVVDALGGIVVDNDVEFIGQNSSSERGHYTVYVPAGDDVLLNGEQALAFARERYAYTEGDFARQQHQQEVIMAMLQGIMRTKNVNTLLNVLDAAGDNITTNMSVSQMSGFLSYALQKANRVYDNENVEDVFTIQSSRVTGYSSSIWNEGLQLSLYIYRLWDGSIADTREAIERNINMDSEADSLKYSKWSINWPFETPSISDDYYNETQIIDEIPVTVSNFIGTDINTVQSFCDTYGITLYITYVEDYTYTEGTVIWQDISEGTGVSDVSVMNVSVAYGNTWTDTSYTETQTCWDGSVISVTEVCPIVPTAETTPTPTPEATVAPTVETTPEPVVETTPEPTVETTPETTTETSSDTGSESTEG